MVTLLYHARTIGYICKRIANVSGGAIQAICDKDRLPRRINGTLVRWDSREPLEADTTVNSAEAVRLSRNKRESRVKLEGLCPPTWFSLGDLQYPCLIRPRRHFAAQKFFVCNGMAAARRAITECGRKRWYASPIVDKKLEYRVFVFQGKALKVVRRFHDDPEEVAWNIANGGRSVRLLRASWPTKVVNISVLAGEKLGLGWYAADVIADQEDKPYVLELNTAPGLQRDKTIDMLAKEFTCNE